MVCCLRCWVYIVNYCFGTCGLGSIACFLCCLLCDMLVVLGLSLVLVGVVAVGVYFGEVLDCGCLLVFILRWWTCAFVSCVL